jgi:hypothetical protein
MLISELLAALSSFADAIAEIQCLHSGACGQAAV